MTIEEQKAAFLLDLSWDLGIWRGTMLPQMLFLFLTTMLFAGMAVFGLYTALAAFHQVSDPDLLKKTVPVFIGGSSSVLGLPLLRLLPMLTDRCATFIRGEREYTAFFAKVKSAGTDDELMAVVKEYQKLK